MKYKVMNMEFLTVKEIEERLDISKKMLNKFKEKGLRSINNRYKYDEVLKYKEIALSNIDELKVGEEYTNNEIANIFGCSTQGGMRRSHYTNTLVIFSDHTKGIYEDIWRENTLFYTGMGQDGDQVLEGNQNITLYESRTNGIRVYLFETLISTQHIYRGEVRLIENPYQEIQNGRMVWIFPLEPIEDFSVSIDLINQVDLKKRKEAKKLKPNDLKRRALEVSDSGSRQAKINVYKRDQFVAEYSRFRANGICDLCNERSPFNDKDNEPYLECHHVEWLSRGGKDNIYNTVALCPNCHRKVHVLEDTRDHDKLVKKLADYRSIDGMI